MIKALAKKVLGRLVNNENPYSKTQQATCAALPGGVVTFLCLGLDQPAEIQIVGYASAALTAYLLWYKDKNDKAD